MNLLKSIVSVLALSLCVGQAQAIKRIPFSVEKSDSNWTDKDVEAEIYFGRSMAAKMLGSARLYDDDAAQSYVNQLGSSLAKFSTRPNLPYYFSILDSDQINAFAAPGGYVFITRGAVAFCKNEAELAGILAHEIGHISERHIVKQLNIKGKNADGVSSMMLASMSGSSQTLTTAFKTAVSEALDSWHGAGLKNRDDEYEADKVSTDILLKAGYEPMALSQFLTRVSRFKKHIKDRERTHPAFSSRIEKIINQVSRSTALTKSFNPTRYANNVESIVSVERDKTLARSLLLKYPPVESSDFQAYLNKIQSIVLAGLGYSHHIPIFGVVSTELFYQRYENFQVISSALLSLIDNEAEMYALLSVGAEGFFAVSLDEKVISSMMGVGYNPMAYQNLLLKFDGLDAFPFFYHSAEHAESLSKNLPNQGAFQSKRWLTHLDALKVTGYENSFKSIVSYLDLITNESLNKYVNLVAFSVFSHLNDASLQGVFVVNSKQKTARLQNNWVVLSTALLNELSNEAQLVGVIASLSIFQQNRAKSIATNADILNIRTDLSVAKVLSKLGYSPFSWQKFLKKRSNNMAVERSDNSNYFVRHKYLKQRLLSNSFVYAGSYTGRKRYINNTHLEVSSHE